MPKPTDQTQHHNDGPYSTSTAAGSAWPQGHPGTLQVTDLDDEYGLAS